MGDITYTYDAYRSWQTPEGKPLILFAAPAIDIEQWVGIPQRGRLAGEETVGFQREQKASRVNELALFFADHRNIVQNPLLAALQDEGRLEFLENEPESAFGRLKITCEDYDSLPILTLLRRLATRLEERTGNKLNPSAIDQARMAELLERYIDQHGIAVEDEDSEEDGPIEEGSLIDENGSADDAVEVGNILLAEETQLVDFYNEIQGRIKILERLGKIDANEVLGFTKDAILGYLKPAVLVDGQHRLRGAVEAARNSLLAAGGEETLLDEVDAGVEPGEAQRRLLTQHSRKLPVSLLLDPTASEHVFQFIVVNQKATPMGKALLGTIVSTSLSHDELQPIVDRLQRAGIKLEDSQAVAYLTRSPKSPFYGLVQTGMSGDQKNLLQWNVFRGLVTIFRDLRNGKLYHETTNDWAKVWEERFLPVSGLVSGTTELTPRETWRQLDGPWREVFILFYTRIRDFFGDVNDMSSHNAWGTTSSNLFNKVSLTILAADYFEFLYRDREALDSFDDVGRTLDKWLENVNPAYFNRDWRLEGLKKDLPAVRSAWSDAWSQYRAVPKQLPDVRKYRASVKLT